MFHRAIRRLSKYAETVIPVCDVTRLPSCVLIQAKNFFFIQDSERFRRIFFAVGKKILCLVI